MQNCATVGRQRISTEPSLWSTAFLIATLRPGPTGWRLWGRKVYRWDDQPWPRIVVNYVPRWEVAARARWRFAPVYYRHSKMVSRWLVNNKIKRVIKKSVNCFQQWDNHSVLVRPLPIEQKGTVKDLQRGRERWMLPVSFAKVNTNKICYSIRVFVLIEKINLSEFISLDTAWFLLFKAI